MQIIQQSFTIVDPSTDIEAINKLQLIERQARISHRSEEKQGLGTWRRFLEAVVMNHGDWSVTRHATATVEIVTDIGLAAEIRTHKSGQYDSSDLVRGTWEEIDDWYHGFTQESTRFVNYVKGNGLAFIDPYSDWPDFDVRKHTATRLQWEHSVAVAEEAYYYQVNQGVPPQIARDVLPRSTACKLGITYTLNQWRYFFLMRTTKQTHPRLRALTVPLLAAMKDRIPVLYDDIEPEQSQTENLKKPW